MRTNEYLNRYPQLYGDQSEESYVMLFQLIGQPNLNQMAREVPPFKSSLTSSGIYVLLSSETVFFWAGKDFYNWYIEDDQLDDFQNFISEELLTKLVYVFENS